MGEYQPRCPKCGSLESEIVKIHNPETYDMQARASLRCQACTIQWEGLVTSPNIAAARKKGWIQ